MNRSKAILKNLIFCSVATIALGIGAISCANTSKGDEAKLDELSPKGYDLGKPEKYNMAESLFEISGITFNNGDAGKFYAIQDEDGDLFHFDLKGKTPSKTKFADHGDYEDLAILNNQVFVLKSNGELYQFPLSEENATEAKNVTKLKDLVPKAEYEGIASIESTRMIYILTKESKEGKKEETTSVYSFHLDEKNQLEAKTIFKISHKEISALTNGKENHYRPSALVYRQETQEWFVLSSVNKQLIVTDASFKVKEVYKLDRSLFNQPEGIALDSNNNLYVANEGGKLSSGNILFFKHNP